MDALHFELTGKLVDVADLLFKLSQIDDRFRSARSSGVDNGDYCTVRLQLGHVEQSQLVSLARRRGGRPISKPA